MFIKFAGKLLSTRYILRIYQVTYHFDDFDESSPIMRYAIQIDYFSTAGKLHLDYESYNVNEHYSYLKRFDYLEKLLCGRLEKE